MAAPQQAQPLPVPLPAPLPAPCSLLGGLEEEGLGCTPHPGISG